MNESEISPELRFLTIQGIARPSAVEIIGSILDDLASPNTVCCFLTFAYADIPFGETYDVLFRRIRRHDFVETRCVLKSATNQFGDHLSCLPYGWKTICVLEFLNGVPKLIKTLPAIADWYESSEDSHLCLAKMADYPFISTSRPIK